MTSSAQIFIVFMGRCVAILTELSSPGRAPRFCTSRWPSPSRGSELITTTLSPRRAVIGSRPPPGRRAWTLIGPLSATTTRGGGGGGGVPRATPVRVPWDGVAATSGFRVEAAWDASCPPAVPTLVVWATRMLCRANCPLPEWLSRAHYLSLLLPLGLVRV